MRFLHWLQLICVCAVLSQVYSSGTQNGADGGNSGAGDTSENAHSGANGVNNNVNGDPNDENSNSSDNSSHSRNNDGRAIKFSTELPGDESTSGRPKPLPPPPAICTVVTQYYDCQIRDLVLRDGEKKDFGLSDRPNLQINVTFIDSRMAYLPQSLIDAFPYIQMLNVADLQIRRIEAHAFDSAEDLSILYLQNNSIKNIFNDAFARTTKLAVLVLSKNEISQIGKNAFTGNPNLQNLHLDDNKLTVLPTLDNNRNLRFLQVSNNKLTALGETFDNHYSLATIDVSNNLLTALTIPRYVTNLNAAHNDIVDIESDQCSLSMLKLSHNKIRSIAFLENCADITILDLSFNSLEEISVAKKFQKLNILRLSNNNLFEINTLPSNLQVLDLSNNMLSYGPRWSLENLEVLLLKNNSFISFDSPVPPKMRRVSLSNNDWDCKKIKPFLTHLSPEEYDNRVCNKQNFRYSGGLCCRDYNKPYNDVLKEVLNDVFQAEIFAYETASTKCKDQQTGVDRNQELKEELRQAALAAEESKRPYYAQLENLSKDETNIDGQIKAVKNSMSKINGTMETLEQKIERQRDDRGVFNEGLIEADVKFQRVVTFTKERNENNKDLKMRRENELSETNDRKDKTELEKADLTAKNELDQSTLNDLKNDEKQLKKQKQKLEKSVHGNSPSIRGSR